MKQTILLITLVFLNAPLWGKDYLAKSNEEIQKFSQILKAGDSLTIAAGKYKGELNFTNFTGTKTAPIIIQGSGPEKTIFQNGRQAIHLVNCHYIILKNFSIKNFSINGINADDGGSQGNPSSGLVFENISISDIGPKGNFDGIKLSGLHKFSVTNCYISGWGGSAVDMVGCHDGIVSNCTIKGKSKYSQSSGFQIKGGSTQVKIYRNLFDHAGQRAINLGGSTGVKWFRPLGAKYEAKNIEVAGNTFIGGMAHIAFVTSQNSHVHRNLFYKPGKWFFRILQETKDPEFIKSQTGKLEKNIFIFDQNVRTFINIGSGTSPETFVFKENLWQDTNQNRKPNLPVKETKGIYNSAIKLQQRKNGTFEVETKYKNLGPTSFK